MSLVTLSEQILRQKKTFLSLDDLRALSRPASYADFFQIVTSLQESGVLRPAGPARGTNGMVPPLRLKYRVLRREETDPAALSEIRLLAPGLNISGYLAHPALYQKHREILLPFSAFLKTRKEELAAPMSINERSYAIWKREKLLRSAACRAVLRYNGWADKMNVYGTPEPFFDFLCDDRPQNLLVLENKDTWYTLRRLLMRRPDKRTLYGVRLDGVVLGEGNKATRPHALEEYASLLPGAAPRFHYFGDLDYEGIQICLSVIKANPALSVETCLPAYRELMARGQKTGAEKVLSHQEKPSGLASFLSLFDTEEAEKMEAMLASGFFLPQEILNAPYFEARLSKTGAAHV